MGHIGKLSGQDFDLFVNRLVFVHNKHVLAFHGAQAAFYLYAGCSQILVGNGHRQFFSQILEFLIYLFRFQFKLVFCLTLKISLIVLYLHHNELNLITPP